MSSVNWSSEADVIYDLHRCQGWEGTKIDSINSETRFSTKAGVELSMMEETVSKLEKPD